MNKSDISALKNYAPTILLLVILLIAFLVLLPTGKSTSKGLPALNIVNGITLIIIGLFAGLLGGLIGTGGCSVMLPAIHFWLGYTAPIAVGTTLFAVIFTAISGGYGHLIRKNLDVKATLWVGASGIGGVIVGSYIFTLLTSHVSLLGLILGLAFLWPAGRMIWEGLFQRQKPQAMGNSIPGPVWGWIVLGLLVGILTGVVGLGGGYALVPSFIYFFGAPVYITMGTSLATMIPLALVGGGIKLAQGFVALGPGLILAAGTVIGAQIGAAIIKCFKPTTLKLIFGLYFLYVSVKFITAFFGLRIW